MMAMGELAAFVERASRCRSVHELRAAIFETGNVVPAPVWGWTRFGRELSVVDIGGHNAPDRFFARYEASGAPRDPLLAVVLKRHIPVHNLQVVQDWDHCDFYREFFQPVGWKHVLHAPVVRDGALALTLHFARGRMDRPFDAEDLMAAFAMANHVSSLLGRMDEDEAAPCLTDREVEIGRLVAAGLNNLEIATCLGITRNTVKGALKRIFRKLDVDARAEMAVRLVGSGRL
jgi:DNA-binding CsgD family transcriptional regulator